MLDSTLIHVTEPFENSEMFLIGTTNSSDLLANRTKNLIRDVKPDVLLIQTEEKWWKAAQLLGHVKSTQEMDLTRSEMSSLFKQHYGLNGRRLAFDLRWIFFAFYSKFLFGIPIEFNPFLPGLEMKYALEEATKFNSKVVYLGYEFDKATMDRMYHENRYTALKAITNTFKLYSNNNYSKEIQELLNQINAYGIHKFLEASCDQYMVNWFVSILDKIYPDVKRILIDMKEQEIFQTLMQNKGKRMVCLVNQIHLEGLEHHWCGHYGQLPRSVRHLNIDPIGDMPLRNMLFSQMYHVIMRDVKTSRANVTPASYTNNVNPYWREWNFQYEHRNM